MKYESELINEILVKRGHEVPNLHYQSECIESWVEEAEGAYPKLCDYESEWLNYINKNPIGEFPYEIVTTNDTATVNNVVPYAYKSAILKGNTGYRDIDTGEFLETFEEGRNLELVSVKMPVLYTIGKNLLPPVKNTWYPCRFKQGTTLMLSTKDSLPSNGGNVVFKDINGTSVWFGIDSGNTTSTKVLPCDVYYISNSLATGVEHQLEIGKQVTSYEPCKTNILTVNEPVELRGIGDVKDTLDLLTGEVAQRVGKTTITGDLLPDVRSNGWNNNSETMCFEHFSGIIPFQWNQIISADWPISNDGYNSSLTHEYFNPQGGYGIFRIKRSRLETEDVNGFKKWLNENPITIYHPVIGSESIKTVDLTVTNQDGETLNKIKPIEGTMHIEVSGTPIAPTAVLEIPVEAITKNLNSFIEEG